MTYMEAEDFYIAQIDQAHGHEFAQMVGRFQEGFLKDKVCRELDDAFVKAVNTAKRLLPAIKAAH